MNAKPRPFSIIASILLAIVLLVTSLPSLVEADGVTYSYDDNGNLVSESDDTGSSSYAYDYQKRLKQVSASDGSVIEYGYDADGIRISKTIDGTDVTNYLVDKNRPYAQVLEERDGSSTLQVSYIYGDDLISQNRGGVDSYYQYDGQLSTRVLTDSSANVTDSYTYDAFGNLLAQTGTTQNNYLYTGEQYDPNAGFYYLRARYYDTGVGRFVTTDPWQGSVSDPASLHKYLYVGADPVNNWDPSGKMTKEEILVDVTIIGVIGSVGGLCYATYMNMIGSLELDLELHWYPIWEWNLLDFLSQQQTAISTGDFEDWTDEEWQEYYDYWEKRDKEHCLLNWWKCYHNYWKGNCTDCFRNCVAQNGIWPKWMCPPGSFAGSVPWK